MKKPFIFAAVAMLILTLAVSESSAQMLDKTASRVQTTLKTGWKTIGSLTPRSANEIKGQNFSLGCETLCRDYIYWDTYKDYVVPLGIKKIRLQGGWAKTEQVAGKYDFAWLDNVIDDARSKGLEIWLETDYGNPIYEGAGGWDLGAGFPTSKEGLAAWDRWVEQMAKRYKGKVRDWAMWNEPDIGVKKTNEQIVDFNIRTAEIIKRIIPDARIGALSLAKNSPKDIDECMSLFKKKGKLHLFDWVVYHGYKPNPDLSYENVEEMKAVIAKYDSRIKLWQGENGCPSEMAFKFALSKYPWTELTQAKWDARRMLGDIGHDVISSIFTICDFDHKGREINRKGLLKINDKKNLAKVKMAYYTVQNLVSVFDNTLVRQPEYSCKIECPVKITWFAWRDAAKKQDLLVLWDGNDIPSDDNIVKRATITVENGQFTDPVWADIITGQIQEIPKKCKTIKEGKMVLKDVPLYDAPVILTDRARLLPVQKPADK